MKGLANNKAGLEQSKLRCIIHFYELCSMAQTNIDKIVLCRFFADFY